MRNFKKHDKDVDHPPKSMLEVWDDKIKETGLFGAPDLVIEILYPSTSHIDWEHKKLINEKYGVVEYFLVDFFSVMWSKIVGNFFDVKIYIEVINLKRK